jgi:hypothetical protein
MHDLTEDEPAQPQKKELSYAQNKTLALAAGSAHKNETAQGANKTNKTSSKATNATSVNQNKLII